VIATRAVRSLVTLKVLHNVPDGARGSSSRGAAHN
jgi:hypothetical protein